MHLDDALGESQADSGSGALGIEFVEQVEDTVSILRLDSPAVVGHEERALRLSVADADLDSWRGLFTHELGGVFDEVLHHLDEAVAIDPKLRQRALNLDRDSLRGQPAMRPVESVLDHHLERNLLRRLGQPAHPRQVEEIVEKLVQLVGRPVHALHVRTNGIEPALEGGSLNVPEESANGDQGTLQVVRDRVCEPLQVGLSTLQLADEGFPFRLLQP